MVSFINYQDTFIRKTFPCKFTPHKPGREQKKWWKLWWREKVYFFVEISFLPVSKVLCFFFHSFSQSIHFNISDCFGNWKFLKMWGNQQKIHLWLPCSNEGFLYWNLCKLAELQNIGLEMAKKSLNYTISFLILIFCFSF